MKVFVGLVHLQLPASDLNTGFNDFRGHKMKCCFFMT